ncbi:MAG: fliQ [Rhodoglobus sp.]|jgi:flagellar biosynthetic protein FliQ|nr:fliQ [Rhodoglobus sp.]
MNPALVIDIGVRALVVAAKLGAPMLVTALVVGFAISVFQSITQIQEVTLSFVPKVVAVAAALVISGQWMIAEMITFTQSLFTLIPQLIGT